MKKIFLVLIAACPCLFACSQEIMKDEVVNETIKRMGDLLEKNYVFPDKGENMKKALQNNLQTGVYYNMTLENFASLVNKDLQTVCPDKHMKIDVFPARPAVDNTSGQKVDSKPRKVNPFKKIEFLPGNIAYVVLNNFPDPALCDEYVISAMNSISGANGVIFDLRNNGGGSPKLVQLILSYFIEEGTLYHKIYDRIKNETKEYSTYKINSGFEYDRQKGKVGTNNLLQANLYVLTAKRTFSAAEEFAYDVQSIKRGKIAGETTGGGAHQMTGFGVYGRIGMRIPYSRPVNPFTGSDWEGTGVKPDIEVKANEALKAAHIDALQSMIAKADDANAKSNWQWELQWIDYHYKNATALPEADMKKLSGKYGKDVNVFIETGELVVEVDMGGTRKFKLQRLDELLFRLDENTMVTFHSDTIGNITGAEAIIKGGTKEWREKVL